MQERQFERVGGAATIHTDVRVISATHRNLAETVDEMTRVKPLAPVTLEDAERLHIAQALEQTDGVIGGPNGAAARLGLPRTTLIARMKRLGINAFQTSGALAGAAASGA